MLFVNEKTWNILAPGQKVLYNEEIYKIETLQAMCNRPELKLTNVNLINLETNEKSIIEICYVIENSTENLEVVE